MKTYIVNVDMKYSKEYPIRAKTKAEAKKKALAKFLKRTPKKLLDITVDEF